MDTFTVSDAEDEVVCVLERRGRPRILVTMDQDAWSQTLVSLRRNRPGWPLSRDDELIRLHTTDSRMGSRAR